MDSSDNLYVADKANNRIRKITFTTADGVVTATGSTLTGSGTEAQFYNPEGVAVFGTGNASRIYVADSDNHRIRKIEYK